MDSRGTPVARTGCPFCSVPTRDILAEDARAFVIADRFPVSLGHTLIISRRHVEEWWDLEEGERASLMALLLRTRESLQAQYRPDGYNVGFNAGAAAGQTVSHVHIHLIPRYKGDVADPRGGIRSIVPDKSGYLDVIASER